MARPTLVHLLLSSLVISPSLAALYTSSSQLPRLSYDYVIVGAGTAGNVLANRLSENPRNQVLVIEAGISDEGNFAIQVPFMGATIVPNTIYDWNYTTTAQPGFNGRSIPYPRGKVLGGCSTVNIFVHSYGASDDYDKYAAVTGDPGWKWDNMKKYIPKHEKWTEPVDGSDSTGKYTPAKHGFNGVLPISLPGHQQDIDAKVIATTAELASEFPYNQDMGGGDVLGIGYVQNAIGGGQRSSSASTYLAQAINRPNLHVLINNQVVKLLPTGIHRGSVSFHAVMFATGAGSLPSIVWASKEIILSAGSIGTPQLLQLSGIGARSELSPLWIPTIVENPSVGKNLSDHVLVPTIFDVQPGSSVDPLLRDPNMFGAALQEWFATKTGILANGITNMLGYLRLPSTASIFSTVQDPSNGPKSAHWELIFTNFWVNPAVPQPAEGSFMGVPVILISPSSRGSTKITTADPFTKPTVNPNFLATQFDIFTLKEGIRAVLRFMRASALSDYVIGPNGDLATATTDAALEQFVRDSATTIYHPVGTAAMSPKGAKWGVVDPDLKVKGTEGLRIVDASVFPFLPSAHTQGPTYLLAHRAADLILADANNDRND
ncbi:hypothetical protein B0H34DRAFT_793279 [Crassisporium funariophilum]|nr:hypothetical protein B0H34DRAFT_793279 [Crassisporium funariophilum]